jgi:glutamate dehydrogenase/leucine dehydrogenase
MSVSKSEVYEWIDSEPTQARGWICIDSVVNGCSSGQLEILCEGTREQAVELARRASFSSAVGVPQVGGASAVIRFDQSDMKCHSVIQRFLKAHMALFSNVLTLVGENDNDTLFLDQCLRSLKLTGSQHAVSKIYAKATNQTDLGESFGPSTTWLGSRVSLADLSRSFGVCQIIKSLKEATSLEKVRVILVGFGSLGSSVAYFIQNQNIGIVVGICDEDGFISSSEGLPVSDILNMRNVSLEKRRLLGQGLTETKRCKQNVLCNLDEAQLRQFNAVQRATSLVCAVSFLKSAHFFFFKKKPKRVRKLWVRLNSLSFVTKAIFTPCPI